MIGTFTEHLQVKKIHKSNEHDMKIYKKFISHKTLINIFRQVSINLQSNNDNISKYKIQDKKH
jgi:hypothetical protein